MTPTKGKEEKTVCTLCLNDHGEPDSWMGCNGCPKWAHRECAHFQDVKNADIKKIHWYCKECIAQIKDQARKIRSLRSENEALRVGNEEAEAKVAEYKEMVIMHREEIAKLTKALHDSDSGHVHMKFKELSDQFSNMQNEVSNRQNEISKQVKDVQKTLDEQKKNQQTSQSQSQVNDKGQMRAVPSYANVLSKPKNKLVVESKNETKAWENKNEILSTLKTIPVDRVNRANKGHVVIEFPNPEALQAAKEKLDTKKDDISVSVNEKKILSPKIIVTHVSVDEHRDEIIDNILCKNEGLKELIKEETDFQIVSKPIVTYRDTQHFIIKCTPEIRKWIYDRGDFLYTLFSRNKIYNRYHVYQCYRCLEFGHTQENCKKSQKCFKCAGNHKGSECESTVKECLNCKSDGKPCDHYASDTKCPIFCSEMTKIRNMTDHGI